MSWKLQKIFSLLALAAALVINSLPAHPQGTMTHRATGMFDVTLTPRANDDSGDGRQMGRMSIDKRYHGDLDATGKGEMLTGMSAVKGSGAYVAIERVSGTLQGRDGSFLIQHGGTMTRGAPNLSITVVPDSGTGQLAGIAGKMGITIAEGKHSYDFEYTLAAKP
jgi:hypothetical protein